MDRVSAEGRRSTKSGRRSSTPSAPLKLDAIITDEGLKPEETRAFIEHAFRDGAIPTTGTAITKILPPASRFSAAGGHGEKKQRVLARLGAFFERFFRAQFGARSGVRGDRRGAGCRAGTRDTGPMSPRPGGEADKIGNLYEGAWTTGQLLRVLSGQVDWVRVEPLGDLGRGVEFLLQRRDGGIEAHQVKRQHGNANEWSIAALKRLGVFVAARQHVDR